jgi:hypothetical protein
MTTQQTCAQFGFEKHSDPPRKRLAATSGTDDTHREI